MNNHKQKQSNPDIKTKTKPQLKNLNAKENPIKLKINTNIDPSKKQTIKGNKELTKSVP